MLNMSMMSMGVPVKLYLQKQVHLACKPSLPTPLKIYGAFSRSSIALDDSNTAQYLNYKGVHTCNGIHIRQKEICGHMPIPKCLKCLHFVIND